MTNEHAATAADLLQRADQSDPSERGGVLAEAQVYATLAVVEAMERLTNPVTVTMHVDDRTISA